MVDIRSSADGTIQKAWFYSSRSPLFMEYNPTLRKGATLNLFAGINDGYTGSVPITHSIEFFNRIVDLRYPGAEELHVPDSIVISLLEN